MRRKHPALMNPVQRGIAYIGIAALAVVLLLMACGCSSSFQYAQQAPMGEAWAIARDITYRSEPGEQDHWQAPEVTLMLGTGDCEDKALLLWYLLKHVHKVEHVYFTVGQVNVLFARGGHAWVELGVGPHALIMDPTMKIIIPRYMLNRISYIKYDSKIYDSRAQAFIAVTGYKDLNSLVGW